jgi:hypothetical protein
MKILEKQGYHLIILALLLLGIHLFVPDHVFQGSFLGISTHTWFWASIILPIIHQIYVVILWRGELYYQLLSRGFGKYGFFVWSAGFLVLFLSRPFVIIFLAISNQGTLLIPRWLGLVLGIACLPLVIYLLYSVLKYFGIKRALGMDHFHPEEYKELPFVKEGIFRWSSNSMYTFGFLLFWIPGFVWLSTAALISALFSHLYIWAHYFFTEYPDMHFIYRK